MPQPHSLGTPHDDTHPALADRLQAMGYTNLAEESKIGHFGIDDNQGSASEDLIAALPGAPVLRSVAFVRDAMKGR